MASGVVSCSPMNLGYELPQIISVCAYRGTEGVGPFCQCCEERHQHYFWHHGAGSQRGWFQAITDWVRRPDCTELHPWHPASACLPAPETKNNPIWYCSHIICLCTVKLLWTSCIVLRFSLAEKVLNKCWTIQAWSNMFVYLIQEQR